MEEAAAPSRTTCEKLQHNLNTGDTSNYQQGLEIVSLWKHMKLQFVSSTIVSLTMMHSGLAVSFSNILNKNFSTEIISYYAGLAALSTPLGSVITSSLTDRIGRKYTLIILQCLATLTWLLVAFAKTDGIIFYASSIFTGMSRGALTSHCPTYISEITYSDYRQMFLSFCTLYFTIGYFIISVFNLWLTPQSVGWCFAVIFAITASFVAVLVPESPHWLGVIESQPEKAKITLKRYNNHPEMFDNEWGILHRKIESNKNCKIETHEECFITNPSVYKPSIILIFLLLFQQFCGIYPLSAYTLYILPKISSALGDEDYKSVIFVIIGITRLLISIVTTFFLSKFNQKQLLSISSFGMVFACLPIVVVKLYVLSQEENFTVIRWSDWVLVVSFVMFIALSCVGVMGIPWTIIFELLPTEVRGLLGPYFVAFGYILMSGWLKTFPGVVDSIGIVNTFVALTIINIAGGFFIHFCVPETRGKSLYEIENKFGGKLK